MSNINEQKSIDDGLEMIDATDRALYVGDSRNMERLLNQEASTRMRQSQVEGGRYAHNVQAEFDCALRLLDLKKRQETLNKKVLVAHGWIIRYLYVVNNVDMRCYGTEG